jgi:uncharacterized membrane protein YedE/YeeE/rhodanese-related sulfurtransferase
MSAGIFPLVFSSDEFMLLTAIGLGFLFGFSLERGGFGNARKLAAQFYLYDMTVFKVMFTAILVAMVGLYTLQGVGLMDLSRLWINPTFVWAQIVGGFLLGVGFIMSGLCPGTSVVSAASGRWDALVTMVGIFVGTAVFVVAVDFVPALERLYNAGSMDVSLLYELFGVSPLVFALVVLAMAGAGFVGAEKVERIFAAKYEAVALTPPARPRLKFTLVGAFAVIALLALGYRPDAPMPAPLQVAQVAPMSLAEAIIGRQPGMMILDLRTDAADAEKRIPGSYPATTEGDVKALLAAVPVGGRVVLVDEKGAGRAIPADWRRDVGYTWLQDGFLGWELRVLTPALSGDTQADREWAARQGQISAYFSGAAVQAADVAAPPPMAGAGGPAPKKKGGC